MKDFDVFDKYLSSHPGLRCSYSENYFKKCALSYRKRFLRFMPLDKNVKIIDLGCGQGALLYWLNSEGYVDIKGVDISSEQVEFCKKNIQNSVVHMEAKKFLSQTEEKYDVIFLTDVLELIPHDEVLGLLTEIYDHLNSKGRFFVQVPNMGNPFNLDARYCEFFHRDGFTAGSLQQVLKLAKFKILFIGSESDEEKFHALRQFLRTVILYFIEKLFGVPFSDDCNAKRILYGRRIYAVSIKTYYKLSS